MGDFARGFCYGVTAIVAVMWLTGYSCIQRENRDLEKRIAELKGENE